MKQVFYFGLVLCSMQSFSQNRYRVNNSGVESPYTDLQVAINANAPGGYYIVEHSDASYGNITVNEKLTIWGTGYFLAENNATDSTQADPRPAVLGNLVLGAQSDSSVIQGLTINNVVVTAGANNITLSRCRILGSILVGETGNVGNLKLSQCFIESDASIVVDLRNAVNFVVNNNVMRSNNAAGQFLMRVHNGTGLVLNNIFYGEPDNQLRNATVRNNYFYQSIIDHTVSGNLTVENNLSNDLFLNEYYGGLANDNKASAAYLPDSIIDFMANPSPDRRYRLRDVPTNPGKAAGDDGKDIGPAGGAQPYIPSGMPPIPSVWYFQAASTGTPGGGVQTEIKAKSRN